MKAIACRFCWAMVVVLLGSPQCAQAQGQTPTERAVSANSVGAAQYQQPVVLSEDHEAVDGIRRAEDAAQDDERQEIEMLSLLGGPPPVPDLRLIRVGDSRETVLARMGNPKGYATGEDGAIQVWSYDQGTVTLATNKVVAVRLKSAKHAPPQTGNNPRAYRPPGQRPKPARSLAQDVLLLESVAARYAKSTDDLKLKRTRLLLLLIKVGHDPAEVMKWYSTGQLPK